MAVLYFHETYAEEARVEQTRIECIRRFRAFCGYTTDGAPELLAARPDLAPYKPHPRFTSCLVDKFIPIRVDGTSLWNVEVDYSTEVQLPENNNPLSEPAIITIGDADHTRIKLTDSDGNPVLNTAGDPYLDPPPEDEETDMVFSIEKNISTRLPPWLWQYRNVVNSDAFRIRGLTFDPGKGKVKGIKVGAEQTRNDIPFCVLSFEIHCRDDGWTLFLPNVGYYQLIDTTKTQVGLINGKKPPKFLRQEILVRSENGAADKPTVPQWLDKKGALITDPTKVQRIMNEFQLKKQLPFSALPLK